LAVDLTSIAASGLYVAKKSLQTTGHNIANVNTEGYSRQRVNQASKRPLGEGGHNIGTGVMIRDVNRIHDKFLSKRYRKSLSEHQFNKERSFLLQQAESVFNEVNSQGLNRIINRFFNSFRELANQPDNESVRSIVRESARIAINDFHRARESLERLQNSIDGRVKESVDDINMLAKQAAKLNIKIAELEAVSGETGDLRDQRDLAVKGLAEYFEVDTFEDERNKYVVNVVGVGTIVTGGTTQPLKAAKSPRELTSDDRAGSTEIFLERSPSAPISLDFKKGRLTALVGTRSTEIRELISNIDQLAYNLIKATNAIHRRGYAKKKVDVDQNGQPMIGSTSGPLTGINFFQEPIEVDFAASNISISDEVKEDLNNIASALTFNSPGDNRVAIAISKLQNEKILGDSDQTLEEHYLKSIGLIGLATRKSKINTEQSEGLLSQAEAMQQRISGVSIDEETANMVKYQHAFEASAKVMQVADLMFQKVLEIKR